MRSGIESLGRLHLQAILLLVAVLAIGVLGGIAFERMRSPEWVVHPRPGSPPDQLPPELSEGLNLTANQKEAIQEILKRNRPRTDAILDQFLPRLEAVTDSVRAEVRAVLTPEQRKIFDRRPPGPFGRDKGLPMRGGPRGRPGPGGGPPPHPGEPGSAGWRPPSAPGPEGGPPDDGADSSSVPPPRGGPAPH